MAVWMRALLVATAAVAPALVLPGGGSGAGGALAQTIDAELDPDAPVALVADEIDYDTTTRELVASGNVEVYYGERTLTADRLIYNDATGRIRAEGNLVLRDPTGVTLFAEFADLDAELKDGILKGAQSVLDRYSRLSAVEARRVDDRYNILSRAVYSACEVCADEPTPLWRIRARQVIHDQENRIIHYEDARLEVFGVPVLWTPYFSHPDPTVERASGFLTPSVSSSAENYGYGVKLPYFLVIDEQTDLTLTPFVTTNDGIVGELEFRRAFETGNLFFKGSAVRSDFTGDRELHGHVDSEGLFRAFDSFDWGWDVKFASDDAYLAYFDFSNEDRLTSELFASSYSRDGFFDISTARFQSLRDDEPAGQIPFVIPDMAARYEFDDPLAGGRIGAFMNSQGLLRTNGEDTGRISFGLDWERELLLPVGLALKGFAEIRGDAFFIGDSDDPDQDPTAFRFAPLIGVEARYPFVSDASTGGFEGITQVIEPVAQFILAPYGGNDDDIPNEDSLITEFDETALFDRSHFNGYDRVEEGPRFNLGLRYALYSDFGLDFDATVGRVLRFDEETAFSEGSGLDGMASDWVGAWSASYDPYVTVSQRIRVADDGLEVTRNEAELGLRFGQVGFDLQYVFLEADPDEGADDDREELFTRARWNVTDEWSVNGFLRRDIERREWVSLGGGVRFANECCSVTAFVRRSFTDQENVSAGTSFGITVELFTLGGTGFGG
ncbi:LPS assembly protein LptD [Paralimibaculum aggregatum]|uniref:LPS-assembly protein LptD n=1 Tax=Paralimibaculum aggregatum TaxID=3036245 RepID=A0ABQ6LH25_9RHOB|nr:LPS assembly protein LptD [Limibaculum sp. NKW23]GMG82302.1 LPS assembly protein LptD [Limibaculum sp. NKW23]